MTEGLILLLSFFSKINKIFFKLFNFLLHKIFTFRFFSEKLNVNVKHIPATVKLKRTC